MPIPKKLVNFLDKSKAKYEVLEHKTVYTAFDKAKTLRVKENIIGKTLVVKIDKNYALVLVPANKNLDKDKFRKTAKVKSIDFVKEAWMKKNIKGAKIGAVPPFGILWKLPTFVDKSLLLQPKIIVNSGDHNFSLKLLSSSFKKLIPDFVSGQFSKSK
ncbi:MAG: YbaK/EbsC family protein [Candidatus Paceibacterota bacterium]